MNNPKLGLFNLATAGSTIYYQFPAVRLYIIRISPDFIYFVTLYNIFNEFLEDVSEDVLFNETTGFKESKIWSMLYNFQKDAYGEIHAVICTAIFQLTRCKPRL